MDATMQMNLKTLCQGKQASHQGETPCDYLQEILHLMHTDGRRVVTAERQREGIGIAWWVYSKMKRGLKWTEEW